MTTPAVPGQPAAAPVPGAPSTSVIDAGTYVPKTKFDNTPHRFNMTQSGKRMSADDFDNWMRAKGYRVAKGAPPAECKNAPAAGVETIVGPDGCPVEVSIELDGVTFAFGKDALRPEARSTLDQAIDILKRHPELTVEVAGHTDSKGDAALNQKLSERRAKAVYDYMLKNGISDAQLDGPIGYGESKPIASNDTDAGRNENRRTELNIKAVAALPAATVAAAPGNGAVVVEGQSTDTTATPVAGTATTVAPSTQPAPEQPEQTEQPEPTSTTPATPPQDG